MSKTVIVTGGARGIGRGLCEAFAKNGYNVVINYNSSADMALELENNLLGMGLSAMKFKADVRRRDEVSEMVDAVLCRYKGIDVLINNAGVAGQKMFCDITDDEWHDMMAVNVTGTFYCCRAVLPSMISRKAGHIINISSIWGMTGASCEVHYSASKAAVIGLTRALAKEVAPCNIAVNCIAPGIVDTDMMRSFDEEERRALMEATPLMRFGTPGDIAEAALYLARGRYMTGQVISPNGGFVI